MNLTLPRLFFSGLMLTQVGLLAAQPLALAQNLSHTSLGSAPATDVYSTDHAGVNESLSEPKHREILYGTDQPTVLATALRFSRTGTDITATPTEPALPMPAQRRIGFRQSLASSRRAAEAGSAQSIIKYAPLSNIGYEHVLSSNRSVYAGLSLYSLGFGASAIGLKAEYRFYGLIKNSPKLAPEGFWVAPTALLWHIRVTDFYDTESAFVAQIGGIAGYQWLFNQKISLEPALGLSLTAVGSGSDTSLGAGVLPLFAVRVGYVLK